MNRPGNAVYSVAVALARPARLTTVTVTLPAAGLPLMSTLAPASVPGQ